MDAMAVVGGPYVLASPYANARPTTLSLAVVTALSGSTFHDAGGSPLTSYA